MTFDQSCISGHQIFPFENLFRQKNRVEGRGGHLENLVGGRLKPSSDQFKSKTPSDVAVIDTIQ